MVFLCLEFTVFLRCVLSSVLYSFRRCPYAIRARYVLALLNQRVELREVVLKAKPAALLNLGGRTSVPQLIDENGRRYPESLDIIFWALSRSSHTELSEQLWPSEKVAQSKVLAWVRYNDHFFKYWLDRYKYADRHPECSEAMYRQRGEAFLRRINRRLRRSPYLLGKELCLADVCIFPFIRQFAAVNAKWFEQSEYDGVKRWLASFVESDLFVRVMVKFDQWEEGQEAVFFPSR